MMKKPTTKRLFTLILTIAMLCSTALTAQATNISTGPISLIPAAEKSSLESALGDVELMKDDFGFSDVNFSLITAGTAIQTYEYLPTGFEELRIAYPLFYGGELLAVALRTSSGHYQIVTYLVEYLKDYVHENIAIVYDADGCYVYDGSSFTFLYERNPNISTSRGSMAKRRLLNSGESALSLSSLAPVAALTYQPKSENSVATSSPVYISTNILHVTQQPYDKICWAACIAMIANQLNGTSLTASMVAKSYYGETNFNQDPDRTIVIQIMNQSRYGYNLGYTLNLSAPTAALILDNIESRYPVYASVDYRSGNGGHAIVVYAISTVLSNEYVVAKDPWVIGNNATYCYRDTNGKYEFINTDGSPGYIEKSMTKLT